MNSGFLAVEEARERILKEVVPIRRWESVGLRDALDRVCAMDVVSPIDVPNHTNSAMDGFSLAAGNLGDGKEETLRILGRSMAGSPYFGDVEPGGCVKIMTGAVVPQGHDAVVPKENVLASDSGSIMIDPSAVKKSRNLRFPGEDLRKGAVAVPAGKLLRPAEIGLLASLGIGEVKVVRRPRIAFFSTGDELRSLGERLDTGQIYDSNRYTIVSMISRLGFDPVDLGVVRDDPERLQEAIDLAKGADAIITSGGVSVGDADFVKELLERNGEVLFWKIAMKPGRPLAFGRIGDSLFFGLPGNPVSVMVTFYAIVQPALWKLAGRTNLPPDPLVRATAGAPVRKVPGRLEYQRCCLELSPSGELLAHSTGEQGSGILKSMSDADGLMVLDAEAGNLDKGSVVNVLLLQAIS